MYTSGLINEWRGAWLVFSLKPSKAYTKLSCKVLLKLLRYLRDPLLKNKTKFHLLYIIVWENKETELSFNFMYFLGGDPTGILWRRRPGIELIPLGGQNLLRIILDQVKLIFLVTKKCSKSKIILVQIFYAIYKNFCHWKIFKTIFLTAINIISA